MIKIDATIHVETEYFNSGVEGEPLCVFNLENALTVLLLNGVVNIRVNNDKELVPVVNFVNPFNDGNDDCLVVTGENIEFLYRLWMYEKTYGALMWFIIGNCNFERTFITPDMEEKGWNRDDLCSWTRTMWMKKLRPGKKIVYNVNFD